jgi:hypothetical protein
VLAAYGWVDIDLKHDFRLTEEGLRFTISDPMRIEVLDRLLELNFARHAQEVGSDLPSSTNSRRAAKGRTKPLPAEKNTQGVFEL